MNKSDRLTIEEVGRLLSKFPIDGKRTDELFQKEPALEEAFRVFSKRYVDDFDKYIGVEFKSIVKDKARDLFCWAITVGYLLKENIVLEKIERMKLNGGKNHDAPWNGIIKRFAALGPQYQIAVLYRLGQVKDIRDADAHQAMEVIKEAMAMQYQSENPDEPIA